MKYRLFFLTAIFVIMLISRTFSAEKKDIDLPKYPSSVKADLVTTLEKRKSVREFAPHKLSLEDVSAILWAANGVNRSSGKRTAPSAYGQQYIDIYIVTDTGGFLYDAPAHRLKHIISANVKNNMSGQDFVGKASHIVVLVANMDKIPGVSSGKESESKLNWAHATSGTIAQNVYLMSAARGVGTCIVAGINEEGIRKSLGLSKQMKPLYVMPLGYEKK
jgi:SagB-type dehydrogenase family enzyme